MSECRKCQKLIFGDELYEVEGKVYCVECAQRLSRQSSSVSPTGFGCKGAYLTREKAKKD